MSKHPSQVQRPFRHALLALAVTASLASTSTFAQSNASGVIFGRAHAAANTQVRVENIDTGLVREITIDAEGRYRAASLPVGRYKVSLQRDGATVGTRDNVSVNIGSGTDVSFIAEASQQLEGIAVVANALPAIDISSVDSRTVITSEQLQKLPLARNTTAAALLAPGTVAADSRYGNVASFGGASAAENQYYINGFSVTNALTGLGSVALPFNAIDQQRVYTGGYGAEYGRSTGGVVEIVTRRGGNTWQGGAQLLWTPQYLADSPRNICRQGRLYQDRSGNKGTDFEYAAYLGGPLIKDKLFFYAAADITQSSDAIVGSIATNTKFENKTRANRWLTKIDWNITDNHSLEFTGIGITLPQRTMSIRTTTRQAHEATTGDAKTSRTSPPLARRRAVMCSTWSTRSAITPCARASTTSHSTPSAALAMKETTGGNTTGFPPPRMHSTTCSSPTLNWPFLPALPRWSCARNSSAKHVHARSRKRSTSRFTGRSTRTGCSMRAFATSSSRI